MRKTIIHRTVPEIPQAFAQLHPVLAKIYASRGMSAPCELKTQHLLAYQDLKGIDEAVAILANALQAQQRILFVGDFDADGATSVAVGVKCLRNMGAQHIDYLV
ncbi:MAG: single-stranded-DNA-specific exonuclease RecJ, partial [Gammaproteobacteria bacterium]